MQMFHLSGASAHWEARKLETWVIILSSQQILVLMHTLYQWQDFVHLFALLVCMNANRSGKTDIDLILNIFPKWSPLKYFETILPLTKSKKIYSTAQAEIKWTHSKRPNFQISSFLERLFSLNYYFNSWISDKGM